MFKQRAESEIFNKPVKHLMTKITLDLIHGLPTLLAEGVHPSQPKSTMHS